MDVDCIINLFCEHFKIDRDSVFQVKMCQSDSWKRYILYKVLKEECNISSYQLAKIFKKARRNIVRGLGIINAHLQLYDYINDAYESFINKVREAN